MNVHPITNTVNINEEHTNRVILCDVAGHAIRVFGDSSGTTINVKGEPTFTGGIDLGKTSSTIVLASDITKDLTIEIYNYNEDLKITDNLSGNDTFSLSLEDLDGDTVADDGILTINGEDQIGRASCRERV